MYIQEVLTPVSGRRHWLTLSHFQVDTDSCHFKGFDPNKEWNSILILLLFFGP